MAPKAPPELLKWRPEYQKGGTVNHKQSDSLTKWLSRRSREAVDRITRARDANKAVDCITRSRDTNKAVDCITRSRDTNKSVDCITRSRDTKKAVDRITRSRDTNKAVDCITWSRVTNKPSQFARAHCREVRSLLACKMAARRMLARVRLPSTLLRACYAPVHT